VRVEKRTRRIADVEAGGLPRPRTYVTLQLCDAVLAADLEVDIKGNANVHVLQRLRPAVRLEVGAVAAVRLKKALGVGLCLWLVLAGVAVLGKEKKGGGR
jgi:hypothetical protein